MMTTTRRNGTVITLRPGSRTKAATTPVSVAAPPPWIALGRPDLLRLIHGLTQGQGWAFVQISAEALADGTPAMAEDRCREIAGRHWDGLWITLQRRRLGERVGGQIRIVWVAEALTAAEARIAAGRKRRDGKGGGHGG